jgi:hypothetical protein
MPTLWADLLQRQGYLTDEDIQGINNGEVNLPGLLGLHPELADNVLSALEGLDDQDDRDDLLAAITVFKWEPPKA